METLSIYREDIWSLGVSDTLTIRQLTANGLFAGSGWLITDCSLKNGQIADTIRITCTTDRDWGGLSLTATSGRSRSISEYIVAVQSAGAILIKKESSHAKI